MSHVIIVGGGIVGLSSAYYLKKAGFQVTVVDQGDLNEGCSFGNAGMIVPSHIIPLAAPGMISKGIRWMFSASSPFYVRPRFSGDLIKWGYYFYRKSTAAHVEYGIPALRDISQFSKGIYKDWLREMPFDFEFMERGLLMLYKQESMEREEIEAAHLANRSGVEAHVLSEKEIQALEPDVRVSVRGGVYYPGDAHLNPGILMEGLIRHLRSQGVSFRLNSEVKSFVAENGKVRSVVCEDGTMDADSVVLATGSWSGSIARGLNLRLPMQAGKGYSFTLNEVKKNIRIPSIFLEARVAVTPMGSNLRFGGTMEISGVDHTVNMNRVKGIVSSIPFYYPDMKVEMPSLESVWHGLRPCSPDGLPYIGTIPHFKNVVMASGHAMMGLSLGPGTGKLVAEILTGEKPSLSLAPFDPSRYDR